MLTVLLELLMSEWETKKFIKGVVSLLLLAALIVPLPSLIKSVDTAGVFTPNETEASMGMSEEYLTRINTQRLETLRLELVDELEKMGCENVYALLKLNDYAAASPVISSVQVSAKIADKTALTKSMVREKVRRKTVAADSVITLSLT